MRYWRPRTVLAGFHADSIDEHVPELVHVGEQWAPQSYFIPSHEHVVWEFYLQLDGTSTWTSSGKEYVLRPGSFFAAAPHVTHAMKDRPRAKHHFFFAALDLEKIFARHDEAALRRLWPQGKCAFVPHAQSLAAPFRQLVREVSMRLPLRTEGLRLAVDYVVIEASRLLDSTQGAQPVLPLHPAVETTKQLLEQRYDQPWRLADLGRLAAVSPNHLVELFTRQVGMSPHQYLLRQRVERAKELLAHSDVPVTQVAVDLGFSSSQHFAKTFRQAVRCSAQQFRKRHQAGTKRQVNHEDTKARSG